MTIEIIYVTHSTTTDNERGIATGWNPGELSETGKLQAAELGVRHSESPPDLVISSDLGRAVHTAEIAFGDTGIEIRSDARLRECNYGDLNAAPTDAIHADRLKNLDEPFPNGESYSDVVERTKSLLEDLPGTGSVLLIAHRAQYYALEHLINGVSLEDVVVAPYVWQPERRYELTR
jgi:broad specificity phosphatase PhoE